MSIYCLNFDSKVCSKLVIACAHGNQQLITRTLMIHITVSSLVATLLQAWITPRKSIFHTLIKRRGTRSWIAQSSKTCLRESGDKLRGWWTLLMNIMPSAHSKSLLNTLFSLSPLPTISLSTHSLVLCLELWCVGIGEEKECETILYTLKNSVGFRTCCMRSARVACGDSISNAL